MPRQPEIPYDPYATVAPKEAPTPYLQLKVPDVQFSDSIGKALGELGKGYGVLGNETNQVGAALAHMGGAFEKAGDEIFNRAVAIKHVENETAATDAETRFRIQGGEMTQAFEDQTSGRAAPEGLKAHMKSLEDARQKIRSTLGNDDARNMFDQSTLRHLGSMVLAAGKHGAAEGKAAAIKSATASFELDVNDAFKNPDAPDFDQKKQSAVDKYLNTVRPMMHDDDTVARKHVLDILTKFNAAKASGMARTNPDGAIDFLKKMKDKGELEADDFERAMGTITTYDRQNTSSFIATRVTEPMRESKTEKDRANEPTLPEMIENADKMLDKHPRLANDDIARKQVHDQVVAARALEEKKRVDLERRAEKGIQAVILGLRSPTGERPKSMNEAKAMGGDQFTMDMDVLRGFNFKKALFYEKKILSGDYLENEENRAEFDAHRAAAKSNDDGTRQTILETNYFEKPWPYHMIKEMYDRQTDIMKGAGKDPALNHAMETLRATVLPPGLNSKDMPDQYGHLRGAIYSNILVYQNLYKKYPSREDITEWGKQWLREESKGWWYGKNPSYEPDKDWRLEYEKRNKDATEEQMRFDWGVFWSKQIMNRVYKDRPPPKELPVERYIREHGGPGSGQ